MTIQDQTVENHPNGSVETTVDKLLKVPTQQANGKCAEKTAPETANEDVKPSADVVVPLDGGFGWIVVLASFICCLVVDGIVMTAGLFGESLQKEFDASKSEVK